MVLLSSESPGLSLGGVHGAFVFRKPGTKFGRC